ncbi:MAG TPA: PorV/PorQ family protein [candidate division Zixibacteria bacterium]|nr:PorV/PorQ family protein [candidate division Zixibacteria bacterium]
MLKKILLAGILLVSIGNSVLADINSKAGTTSYTFLRVGPLARVQAMGGAYTGLADDEGSLFYNPSGLAKIKDKTYLLSYSNYITDVQSGFVGLIYPLKNNRSIGVSFNYLNWGDIVETDSFNNTLGTFAPTDIAFSISGATVVNPSFDAGATVKIIFEKLSDYSTSALAVDLGGIYTAADGRTRFGVTVLNFGKQMKAAGSRKESLPTVYKIGFSHHLKELPLVVAGDLNKPRDNNFYINLGGEFVHFKNLLLRMGWSSNSGDIKDVSESGSLAGFGFGLGFLLNKFKLDYSYSSFADLGSVHRFTIAGSIK